MFQTIFKKFHVRSFEIGLHFVEGEFVGLLREGKHRFFDPFNKVRVDIESLQTPWLMHDKLKLIVRSGKLGDGKSGDPATVVDLKDHERALVWIDGRFEQVLPPGLYAYWNELREVRVEKIDARQTRFEHAEFKAIIARPFIDRVLSLHVVEPHHRGVLFVDGEFVDTFGPGRYAFWKNLSTVSFVQEDLRETMFDVAGQEIMTADKVTLRVNAVVTYRVADVRLAVTTSDNARQALYREVQLALRAAVGARELDAFLNDKDRVTLEVADAVRDRATTLGLELASIGVRDVILPGDMKDLMNKVTEAKKAAEANLIFRREETAAIRSQANTAKLLADNPTLMRLRELEVLEKVAANSKLNIVLGDVGDKRAGLAERVLNVL